jgi:membrane protein YdbS with pleckstrin-like domain
MEPQSKPQYSSYEIPGDATVVKQVQYAWVWSSTPWLVGIGAVLFFFPEIFDPAIALVLTITIIVPRYFMWRRTAYIVTNDTLIYQRGGILKTTRYPIPISTLKSARARYGRFGKALGYQAVDIVLESGAVASLAYLPPTAGVAEKLQELIDASEPETPEGQDAEGLPDGPSSSGPDGPPDEKTATD